MRDGANGARSGATITPTGTTNVRPQPPPHGRVVATVRTTRAASCASSVIQPRATSAAKGVSMSPEPTTTAATDDGRMTEQVGSGRRHGQRPAGGPELTLYEATHGHTAWEDPEPADVATLIRWYRTLPGCATGGSLHIVIDDNNCNDGHLEWCSGYAFGVGDTCGSELAGLLLNMDAYARVHAVDLANERVGDGA